MLSRYLFFVFRRRRRADLNLDKCAVLSKLDNCWERPTSVSNNSNTDYLCSSYYQNCAIDPVTYRWEISWDYGNTFSHLSFTEDAILDGEDVPPQAPKGIVRLTAVCAGDSSVVLLDIINWSAQNLVGDEAGQAQIKDKIIKKKLSDSDERAAFIVYPNPTIGMLNIQLANFVEGTVSINIISSDGKKYSLHYSKSNNADKNFLSDISSYPPGFCILEIRTDAVCLKQPIILTRS